MGSEITQIMGLLFCCIYNIEGNGWKKKKQLFLRGAMLSEQVDFFLSPKLQESAKCWINRWPVTHLKLNESLIPLAPSEVCEMERFSGLHLMQTQAVSKSLYFTLPFIHAWGIRRPKQLNISSQPPPESCTWSLQRCNVFSTWSALTMQQWSIDVSWSALLSLCYTVVWQR